MSQPTAPCPQRSVFDELRRAIVNVAVPHHESPGVVRRRRVVVAVTLVIGAVVLGFSLRQKPGDPAFYWLTLLLAAVWMVGSFFSGPLHLGGICWRGRNQRPVITGTTVGVLLGGVFVVGGLVAREIPVIAEFITHVLRYANQGAFWLVVLITLINGIAEEMFFRGALYSALGRHSPVVISTVFYICATLASGNPMLGFAAIILGTVCALERRATGGILAPMLTHFVWGLIMVLVLPPMFGV
ncbi:CPBP family intramembrane glutamic endopeptidase [Mycobacterium asiaticum]|uniref:Abortive infection protein n=1 Tax=Mycobacterium asiaticum TaxID=1790 RepID=A0A1A3CWK3_MYCAS|nr:type II CAAX endopeptidase family protein [Mycobacterium asiaticum]OBI90451.1 abortive infection protein [Mycobacterium asiaticum]